MEQRELMFRVFNVQTQEYDRDFFPSADVSAEGHFFFIADASQMIVEQSTGLFDMHKRPLFENDVVKYRVGGAAALTHVGVVKMHGYYWGVKKEFGFGSLADVEWVGTIHDKEYKNIVA